MEKKHIKYDDIQEEKIINPGYERNADYSIEEKTEKNIKKKRKKIYVTK